MSNMNDAQLKMVAAAALLTVWGVLVAFGQTDADAYVNFIQSALVGLGVFHAALTIPPKG